MFDELIKIKKKVMKYVFLTLLTPIMNFVSAQSVDSIAMKQVDSLIQVSRGLTSKRNYDQALEVNATAEKIALEKLGRNSATYGNCCFNHGRVSFFKTDYLQAEKWYLESKLIRKKRWAESILIMRRASTIWLVCT